MGLSLAWHDDRLGARDPGIKIFPVGIVFFDQPNFPSSIPFLQTLFSLDRVFGVIELFKVNESDDVILFGEAFNQFRFVLPDSTNEVGPRQDLTRARHDDDFLDCLVAAAEGLKLTAARS
jgi:hypothetical protein